MNKIVWKTMHAIVMAIVWIDRRFWKAYFGIETPLYKIWHELNAKEVQCALNREHNGIIF